MLDRPAYLEVVGIASRTLTRWVVEGHLVPTRGRSGRGRHIYLFSKEQVRFGRALEAFLRTRKGEMQLADAVAVVRGEVDPPDEGWHNPSHRLVPEERTRSPL